MLRCLALAGVLLAAAGCGGSDPASRRLEPGEPVVFVSAGSLQSAPVYHGPDPGRGKSRDSYQVELGAKGQVESDAASPIMLVPPGSASGAKKSDFRMVRVLILEGEYKGRVGDTFRNSLRPAPK